MTNKKRLLALALLMATGGAVAGYFIGKFIGVDEFVEKLIHMFEQTEINPNIEWPVFESNDPKLGRLMYEIKAECIGD